MHDIPDHSGGKTVVVPDILTGITRSFPHTGHRTVISPGMIGVAFPADLQEYTAMDNPPADNQLYQVYRGNIFTALEHGDRTHLCLVFNTAFKFLHDMFR
jgi:hypothetical protein